jgi:hypothetical protein
MDSSLQNTKNLEVFWSQTPHTDNQRGNKVGPEVVNIIIRSNGKCNLCLGSTSSAKTLRLLKIREDG